MVQQYTPQPNWGINQVRLSFNDLKETVNKFNSNPTTKANGVSVILAGKAESYAYRAVLKYHGKKVRFLIYPNMGWSLGDTILASTEKEYAYFTDWDLQVKFVGLEGLGSQYGKKIT